MKNKKVSVGVTIFLSLLCLIVGLFGGFVGFYFYDFNSNAMFVSDKAPGGDLEIHCLELGNHYTGDCVYIRCGDTDILVDGGSRTNSVHTIKSYLDNYITDSILEYAIVTHADRDHIACFAGDKTNPSLFSLYDVKTIIDFPRTGKNTDTLKNYYASRDLEIQQGAKHYSALECWNNENGAQRTYEIGANTNLTILYNHFYEFDDNDENNYSVCFQIEQGDNKFLFTGDLEKEGEEYLVEKNANLGKVKFFKSGHHGSPTSSNDVLLNIIQPEIVVATCCAGSVEYTSNLANTFPSQAFVDRISKWTDKVYAPTYADIVENGVDSKGKQKYKDTGDFHSLNGNIVVKSVKGNLSVECSNNNTLLKDTEWFKTYRTTPQAWVA